MKSISIKLNDEDFKSLENQRESLCLSRGTYIKYLLNLIKENGGLPKLTYKTLAFDKNNAIVEVQIEVPIQKKNKRKYPKIKIEGE